MRIKQLGIVLFILNTLAYTEEIHKKENQSFGVEFNIIRPLLMKITSDINSLSGGINYFDDTRGVEVALPFTYNKILYDNNFRGNDYDDTSLTIDLHYRKFFQNEANGFYLGGFGRYAYLEGKSNNAKIVKQNRFGIGTELGVRLRDKKSSTYLGVSFAVGVYLDKDEANFVNEGSFMDMDRKKYFWDIELLKFGYEF